MNKIKISSINIPVLLFVFLIFTNCKPSENSKTNEAVFSITKAGNYNKPGTYILENDIASKTSALFLGKNITLDLNGHSITYAGGDYEHIPNFGFEEGLGNWDVSNAPGAKVVNTADVHAFIGDKIMSLETGDELFSPFINLPVEGRSYFAICGVTGRYYKDLHGDLNNDMKVSIFVDDENGNEVECINQYGDTTLLGCPVQNRSTRLGGGFVYAHLKNLPAGKYRIRIKAETDCLVDQIDIRPAMDVGIGIVENTHPFGHYNYAFEGIHSAFYDYTANFKKGSSLPDIPKVEGEGTVTIKNGTIKSGTLGVMSWGIQSTASQVRIILENVKIITSGINAIAVDVPHATITNCEFEINNPFLINRHGSEFYGVDLRGDSASDVSHSKFYGGQGCLVVKGLNSKIYNNLFVNRQTVTNHYSVMAMGDGSKIFDNIFKPEMGSGLEIFRHKNIEIYNNEFVIKAAPPSCEYHEHYSTNAIRIADYGAELGSPRGSFGNKIYNNTFQITGKKFAQYPDYIPMASAIFYSTSAGDNFIFDNEISIYQQNPETDAQAFAFYIGNARKGQIYNNSITTNATPIWIASDYGAAKDIKLFRNKISKDLKTQNTFKVVKMGSLEQEICVAENIEFNSNEFNGLNFEIEKTNQNHSYSVSWTLNIEIENANSTLKILDKTGKEIPHKKPENDTSLTIELPEYSITGKEKTIYSPYKVIVDNMDKTVVLNKNISIRF